MRTVRTEELAAMTVYEVATTQAMRQHNIRVDVRFAERETPVPRRQSAGWRSRCDSAGPHPGDDVCSRRSQLDV